MLKQQKRHSQQITNTKKPIRPIQLTISKRNSNMNLLTQSSTYYGYENVLSINNNYKDNNNKKGINISSSGSRYNQQKQKQKQNSNVKNVAPPMILSLGARIRKPLMEGSLNAVMMGRGNQNQNNKNLKKQYNNRNSQGRQQQYSHPIEQNNQNHHFTNTYMTQSVHIQPSIPSSMMMSTNIQNVNSKDINIHVDEKQKSYSLVAKTIRPNKIIQSVKYECVSQKQQLHQPHKKQSLQQQKYDHISVDSLLIMGSKLQQLLKKVNVVGDHHHNYDHNNNKQTNQLKQQNDLVQDMMMEREITNSLGNNNNNVQDNLSQQQQRQQPTTMIQTTTTINISKNIEYYKDFQQRLQLCLQQLNQLQYLNNTQRILQLQLQIATLKQTHHQQQSKLINKIKQLQGQLQKHNSQKQTNIKQQQQKLQQQQLRQQQFSKLLSIDHHTTQQNDILCNQSNNRQQSIATTSSQSHYITTNTTKRQTINNQEQSFYYELDILKRKYSTLQQLLQTKRSQILNKDHIIKLLLKQKVESIINNNKKNNNNNNNNNIIIDSVVDQMFSLMQSKLCIQ